MKSNDSLVIIILSTYNGERYLAEQLHSLLNQSYKNLRIIVRDDGSKDGTCEILKYFSQQYKNIDIICETNIGVVSSFLKLLTLVPPEAGYVALCDQDDVWIEDKIERAVSIMCRIENESPLMYCGAVELVDQNLNYLDRKTLKNCEPSLANALVENIATGCTILLNKNALQLILERNVVENKIAMHDWWLYVIISAFGRIIYDNVPKIKYRQHNNNVVGSSTGIKLWINRIKRYISRRDNVIQAQVNEFFRVYSYSMRKKDCEMVKNFLHQMQSKNILNKVVYIIRTPIYRQRFLDNIIFKILFVIGRI